MSPVISIICQEGGHSTALAYAEMVAQAGLPLLVNFPSTEGYEKAITPSQLINSRTGALLVIISDDFFPGSGISSKSRIDTEIIQQLLSLSYTDLKARIYLVVVSQSAALMLKKSPRLSQLQWLQDNAITREQILQKLSRLAESDRFSEEISAFRNTASLIAAVEPGRDVDLIASERIPSEKISYEIFKCSHRVRKTNPTYYIYLHRGIAIANSAKHLQINYPEIYTNLSKIAVLSVEKGQTKIKERLDNIKIAMKCEEVEYLEVLTSKLLAGSLESSGSGESQSVNRKFVEPQVRRGVSSNAPATAYDTVLDWLSSSRAGVLVLVGQGGIGKTWAMLNLRERVSLGEISFSKPISRTVAFISSTDLARGFAEFDIGHQGITLWDLYRVSRVASNNYQLDLDSLSQETFYNALELGSLTIFVDGLDEIIARNKSRFNTSYFFDDLNDRFMGDSDGKVILSSRNMFFDPDEYRLDYPYIEALELLAFDKERRDRFLAETLGNLPRRVEKAKEMSDRLALLPDGRYVPFVLDLIKDIALEQADENLEEAVPNFSSDVLGQNDVSDRIIGQFCHRETVKILDPLREITVDQQVNIFCQLAKELEAGKGRSDRVSLERIISHCIGRSNVSIHTDHFLTHPFISQDAFALRGIVDFRFDFMPEYFMMILVSRQINQEPNLDWDDVKIINKLCSGSSTFCREIAARCSSDPGEYKLKLIQMYDQATALIASSALSGEDDILRPESSIAQFSSSIVSLIAMYESQDGNLSVERLTNSLLEVFGSGFRLYNMAILEGFVRDEEKLRIDFRGLTVENCLFHSLDIWNCQFDEKTIFTNCRFVNCVGVFARSSGMHLAIFSPDCQLDSTFERIYSQGNKSLQNTEARIIAAIRSFLGDFYRQGAFRRVSKENLERYFGQANSGVPFSKIYRIAKRQGIIEEMDRGLFVEVKICESAVGIVEKMITQGVVGGIISQVIVDLR